MRKSRRVAVAVAVSGLVAAGGITFGLIANANTQGFCDSSGSGASGSPITCTLPNSTVTDTTIDTPSAIQAIVTLQSGDGITPADQYIVVTYSMFCSEGGNQATTTNATAPALPAQQAITTTATVTDTLAFNTTLTPNPDTCTVSNLTATLEASTDGKNFSQVTKGAFQLQLAYTPAAGTSSTATATATATPTTTHVSTISGYGGKCLDDRGNSSSNRAQVIIWSCNNSDSAQGWTFSGGELKHNSKCANIQGGGGSGSKLILWSCNGASNEKWFHSSSNGEYVSSETGHGLLCVDDPGYSRTNGKQLIVYTCHNSGNQHWSS
jgi:ricin-type beta-trefoil lectin protein